MSGRRSVSTRMGMKRSRISAATCGSAYVERSISWHARLLAGAVFGEILRRFSFVSYAAGVILLGTLVVRAILGPRPRRFAWRAVVVLLMLAATAYAAIVVAGHIHQLQLAMGVAPSSLPVTDPRRI